MVKIIKNKKVAILIATVIFGGAVIGVYSINSNAAMTVSSYPAKMGSLSSEFEVNGTVESNTDKVYYSDISAKIESINVREGDFVKKGDVIVSYNGEDIERLETLADLEAQANLGSYNNSIQIGNRTAGLYSEAKKNLATLDQQIADTQAAITNAQNFIAERQASLADFGAKLQVSLIEWADQPDSEEYENLQKLIQTNAYEQQYAPDIVEKQEELNDLNIHLTNLEEYKAEMTSQKASTAMSLMTQGAKDQLEAVKNSNDITNAETMSELATAKEGVIADFDGIVTKIDVVEGSNIAKGSSLFTIKSTSDIIIRSNVNKYDIVNIEEGQSAVVNIKNKEYKGTVSRIERMTIDSGTGTGIGVEISLDDPDENIILGFEAKSKILTADQEQVLCVPLEALNEDEDGSYVFVNNDGKAEKVFVECGIRNDDMVEIRSGISEGSIVVWNDSQELTDGMDIKVNK